MTALEKTIERALWDALTRHAQSAYGTVAMLGAASGPGQPAKVAGFFYLDNVARDIAAAIGVNAPTKTAMGNLE